MRNRHNRKFSTYRIESLEGRRLLSLAAASLDYVLIPGNHWTTTSSDGKSATIDVRGQTTYNGFSATDLHTSEIDGSTDVEADIYLGVDGIGNFVDAGFVSVNTDSAANPPTISTATLTINAPGVVFPKVLIAGQPYTSPVSTATETIGKNTSVASATETITLVSDTPQKITVPAGTFMCYQINTAETGVTGGVINSISYVAPGFYPIELIDDVGPNQIITKLTSFGKVNQTPKNLAFDTQPGNGTVATVLAPPVKVDVEDTNGAIVLNDASTVTLEIASGPAGGVLSGTLSVAATAGVATFSDLKFSKQGSYTLKATDSALTPATTSPFTIGAAGTGAAKLAFGVVPSRGTADKALAPGLTVKIESPKGAVVTSDTSTVTIAVASGPGTLGGTFTAQAVKGVATFKSLQLSEAGSYTLKATDGSLTPATSHKLTIAAVAAAKLVIGSLASSGTVNLALAPALVVDIEDASGNIIVTDHSNVTVRIASGPPGGKLSGTITVASSGGVATFTNLKLSKAGSYKLRVSRVKVPAVISTAITVG